MYLHVDQCLRHFLCEIMNSMIYSECKSCFGFFYLFMCKLSPRDNDIIPHSPSPAYFPAVVFINYCYQQQVDNLGKLGSQRWQVSLL